MDNLVAVGAGRLDVFAERVLAQQRRVFEFKNEHKRKGRYSSVVAAEDRDRDKLLLLQA